MALNETSGIWTRFSQIYVDISEGDGNYEEHTERREVVLKRASSAGKALMGQLDDCTDAFVDTCAADDVSCLVKDRVDEKGLQLRINRADSEITLMKFDFLWKANAKKIAKEAKRAAVSGQELGAQLVSEFQANVRRLAEQPVKFSKIKMDIFRGEWDSVFTKELFLKHSSEDVEDVMGQLRVCADKLAWWLSGNYGVTHSIDEMMMKTGLMLKLKRDFEVTTRATTRIVTRTLMKFEFTWAGYVEQGTIKGVWSGERLGSSLGGESLPLARRLRDELFKLAQLPVESAALDEVLDKRIKRL